MTELERYRQEIDRIDGELVRLFLERMAVTGKVGEFKQREGIPVLDAARERQVIAAKTALTDDPARKADVAALYEGIMAISRRQQRHLVKEGSEDPGYAAYQADLARRREPVAAPRVAYQGEPGCYSEEAAAGYFGPNVNSVGLPWFNDVFAALERGEADYAVLPVENSSTGSIRQVYDLLSQYRYYIVGEWQVPVEHCLMALPGVGLSDIRKVYSHEQGLMQSEKYLDAHRDWERVPTLDTAGSAKLVAETGDRSAAAICSRRAAQLYGLNILAQRVNHNIMNHTRFAVVSPVPDCPTPVLGIGCLLPPFRICHNACLVSRSIVGNGLHLCPPAIDHQPIVRAYRKGNAVSTYRAANERLENEGRGGNRPAENTGLLPGK